MKGLRRILRAAMAAAAMALTAVPVSSGAATVPLDTRVFSYTGREQTFIVPRGVTRISVRAEGADGGLAQGGLGQGLGAWQVAGIAVRPGERLYVEDGGHGSNSDAQACPGVAGCTFAPGGFDGGGTGSPGIGGGHSGAGGGGASDVQTMPIGAGASAVSSRLVVAGGGGGAGGDGAPMQFATGGDGGSVGYPGGQGSSRWSANKALIGGFGG